MKTHRVNIETGDQGYELSAIFSEPDEKHPVNLRHTLAIMMHDIPYGRSSDHNNLYGYLRNIFDERGLQTLTFDFQSCGDSDGLPEEFTLEMARDNIAGILCWAKHHDFQKFVFVAAGITSALALEQADRATVALLLFWPVVDLAAYSQKLFPRSDICNNETVVIEGRKISTDMIRQMESYDIDVIDKTSKIPVLIQYGAQDNRVGSGHIELIKSKFNGLRIDITSYSDGGHGLTDPRHRKTMAHHIGQFLHKYT